MTFAEIVALVGVGFLIAIARTAVQVHKNRSNK